MIRSLLIAVTLLTVAPCSAFVTPGKRISSGLRATFLSAEGSDSVIVVSPPGGVGEVAAVKAAEGGSSVRWFVVSRDKESQQVVLSQESLDSIAAAGGSVDLAGADAASLLLPSSDSSSALPAVSTWCGSADAIICTLDGCEEVEQRGKKSAEDAERLQMWKGAIKVAAKEASASITGTKLTICSAFEEEDTVDEEEDGGLGSLVGSLLGSGKVTVPSTLSAALSSDSSSVTKLRYGQIFGTPESSPDFTPLVGGPRREPELCEEYISRTVRVDPSTSVSGNVMMGSNTRSSRHAVGEAGALMALGKVPFSRDADVCVSSQRGTDPPSLESWTVEFNRVQKMMEKGGATQLFASEFTSVPDIERLADWLAAKWAPAVLRTYDIATIRSGARPVFAGRAGDGKVEVVWQELINFDTVVTGRMLIGVSNDGLVAVRGAGDATKGFGSISNKPLPGEDVLVRRLAEAASQAVEKGLATKKKVEVAPPKPKPEPVAAVSSLQSSATIVAEKPPTSNESGPRTAGARRSTERSRGRKRKDSKN